MWYSYFNSIIGWLQIESDGNWITSIALVDKPQSNYNQDDWSQLAKEQLRQYFAKERKVFDLPLKITGTAFQKEVYRALQSVEYGQTISYQQLAILANHPQAQRAVGGAIHRNPFLIVVPCHRVIQKNGEIGGFALGKEIKQQLLALETTVQ